MDAAKYGTGSVDAAGAVGAAIDACPLGKVVFIPAGTYRMDSRVYRARASHITVRGAGMGKTVLKANSGGQVLLFGTSDWPRPTAGLAVTDGATKGNKVLTVADAFEAMTAARPYRLTPLTGEEAMAELRKFAGIQFDPEIVESERGVIASERRNGVDANNFGMLAEQLSAAAFTAHPYQWPVVGWMSDIEAWTLDDLKNHFKMGYSPSNATMVVSGDVTFDEIVALAQKYIEPIPSNPPPPKVMTTERPPVSAPHASRVSRPSSALAKALSSSRSFSAKDLALAARSCRNFITCSGDSAIFGTRDTSAKLP
mgnify:CR=1 FL=1